MGHSACSLVKNIPKSCRVVSTDGASAEAGEGGRAGEGGGVTEGSGEGGEGGEGEGGDEVNGSGLSIQHVGLWELENDLR